MIVTRAYIRQMAREAFEAGQSRDSHNMNWHAPALVDWLGEYDRLAKSTPRLHGVPVSVLRIDAGQTA